MQTEIESLRTTRDEFVSTVKSLRQHRRIGRIVVALLLVAVVPIANVSEISGGVLARGKFVFQSVRTELQSLNGGTVEQIYVVDGAVVEVGQLLAKLNDDELKISIGALRTLLDDLIAKKARLYAEANRLEHMQLPDGMSDAGSAAYRLQEQLFHARRSLLANQREQTESRRKQILSELEGLRHQKTSLEKQGEVVSADVKMVNSLHSQGAATRQQTSAIYLQNERLQSDLGSLSAKIVTAEERATELLLQYDKFSIDRDNEAVTELMSTLAQLEETRHNLDLKLEALLRTEIRAPISGTVHDIRKAGADAVVQPSETLLTIAPIHKKIEVEVMIADKDIDQVHLDQNVKIRLASVNLRNVRELSGVVQFIAPDATLIDRENRWAYKVNLKLNKAVDVDVDLLAGMPVDVMLGTEMRSVLSYLVRPLTNAFRVAFRES
jgi:HlyD family secretion protein